MICDFADDAISCLNENQVGKNLPTLSATLRHDVLYGYNENIWNVPFSSALTFSSEIYRSLSSPVFLGFTIPLCLGYTRMSK